MIEIREATPDDHQTIHALNSLCPAIFPRLSLAHLRDGCWWLAWHGEEAVGFAGLVAFGLPGVGYLKRCFIRPKHRGQGLQREFMRLREARAVELGFNSVVTDTRYGNVHSVRNLREMGFKQFQPDQPWAENSEYWIKQLPDRQAVVAHLSEDGTLMLGRGDHTCDRWRISESLLRKLARELIPLVIKP